MTEKEQKIFNVFAIAGAVVTVLGCSIAILMGDVTPIELVGGFSNFVVVYFATWVNAQRTDQVVYMDWRLLT